MRRVRRRGSDRLLKLVTLAVACLAQACERDALMARRERVALDIEATRRAAPSAEAPVVARIQGGVVASVSASALERELELRADQTRDEALERLMRRELLWLELEPSALQLDEERLAELDAASKRGRVDAMIERELAAPERQKAIAPEELSLYARRIAPPRSAPPRAFAPRRFKSPCLQTSRLRRANRPEPTSSASLSRCARSIASRSAICKRGSLSATSRSVKATRSPASAATFLLVGNMKFAADSSFEGSLPEGWGARARGVRLGRARPL